MRRPTVTVSLYHTLAALALSISGVPLSLARSLRLCLALPISRPPVTHTSRFTAWQYVVVRYYALDLNSADCSAEMTGGEPELRATANDTVPPSALYVHPSGRDTNPGTITHPLKSIQLAMDQVASRSGGAPKTVVLRGGTHYITDTIYLRSKHSNITVRGPLGAHTPLPLKSVRAGPCPGLGFHTDNHRCSQGSSVIRV
jgi:hypothetical protein